ncbi:cytidine deaminase-like protein [Trichodelitschia bisporula]|uniref:Cytidine deaminase-like protein n=1 Tax=Trichodelitschia bisporula TaxID=703511 RepID=A0A6G1I5W3_9PEZI|nr:cytidine deaminase-like protein [Trichodelitschia bisporula]
MAACSAEEKSQHLVYLRQCLSLACRSPPKPTNFRVGALLVDQRTNSIITTGYTLELPGNVHAEQCCLSKVAAAHDLPEERVGEVLPDNTVMYSTMEPCGERLSGNLPCAERIVRAKKVRKVVYGVREPSTFIKESKGKRMMDQAGIQCVFVSGLEGEILATAIEGHKNILYT